MLSRRRRSDNDWLGQVRQLNWLDGKKQKTKKKPQMLKKMQRTHPHVSAKRHMRASVMVDASSSVVSSKHLKGQLSHNSIVTTSSIYLYIYIFIFHLVDSTQPAATPPYT